MKRLGRVRSARLDGCGRQLLGARQPRPLRKQDHSLDSGFEFTILIARGGLWVY